MAGAKLKDLGFEKEVTPPYWAVKESVFPFVRFPGAPVMLTPEMRSTGEVMGLDTDLGIAFAKTQMAIGTPLPQKGNVFVSVKDADKHIAVDISRRLVALGFNIFSTSGTASVLADNGVPVTRVFKINEGRPNIIDRIKNGDLCMIINTPHGSIPRQNENVIRTEAVRQGLSIFTTMTGARTAVNALYALRKKDISVQSLQRYGEIVRTKSLPPD